MHYYKPKLGILKSVADLNCGDGSAADMTAACNNGPGIKAGVCNPGQTAGSKSESCNSGTSAVYKGNDFGACKANGIVASNEAGGKNACAGMGVTAGNTGGCVDGNNPVL